MSITITIMNNTQYCGDHNLIKYEKLDSDNPEHKLMIDMGENQFVRIPFRLRMSNINFGGFWNALKIPFDYAGTIDAVHLKNLLDCMENLDHEKGYYSYRQQLKEIIVEAIKRDEKIIWS